jgi:glycosyltransferase involved in cell wall biosynthesis
LNDYVHVLGMLSETWVGSTYTKRVLEAHGVSNVHVVPAPIAAPGKPRDPNRRRTIELRRLGSLEMSQMRLRAYLDDTESSKLDSSTLFRADDCISGDGRIFLSVFNPGDPRKNAASMMLGFQDYISRSKRNDLLIIKLIIDDRPETFRTALTEYLPRQFAAIGIAFAYLDCPNIMLVPGRLSDQEMTDLYDMADFYLCTSAAEGQGLPLQEAMAAGVVPISPRETAMADYITPENAVILQADEAPLPRQVTDAYALGYGTWRIVNHHEVSRGLAEASALSREDYAYRSDAAAAMIKSGFSREQVVSRVRDRLSEGGRV